MLSTSQMRRYSTMSSHRFPLFDFSDPGVNNAQLFAQLTHCDV